MKSSRSIKDKGLEHRLNTPLNHSGDLIKVPEKLNDLRYEVFDLIDSAYSVGLGNIKSVRRFLLELIEKTDNSEPFKEFYFRRCLGSALKITTWESVRELIYLILETKGLETKSTPILQVELDSHTEEYSNKTMKNRKSSVDVLQDELNQVLHPPYIQMTVTKRSRPHYKYEVHNQFDKFIVGAQTMTILRLRINQFLSVDSD